MFDTELNLDLDYPEIETEEMTDWEVEKTFGLSLPPVTSPEYPAELY